MVAKKKRRKSIPGRETDCKLEGSGSMISKRGKMRTQVECLTHLRDINLSDRGRNSSFQRLTRSSWLALLSEWRGGPMRVKEDEI